MAITSKMEGLTTFLISTGALTFLSLTITCYDEYKKKIDKKKLVEKVLSSPETSWKKVGKVKEVFCYPLKSGKAISLKECYFKESGITAHKEVCPVEDRMFIAFEENTNKLITARTHPKLMVVKFSFLTKSRAKFEAANMPPMEFDLPDVKLVKSFMLMMWDGESVTGIDCGAEPSKWLSQFLNGSDSGIRLAMRAPNKRRDIAKTFKLHAQHYPNMRDEDSGLFSDLASYMILSQESVDDLNNRIEKPIQPLQLRPNIVVAGCEPYDEDDWDWIKIGNQAIIRRFQLCCRCTMTRIDPDTGIPDPKYEPLKTLRTYRKLKDPVLDKLENYAPAMGVYCGLYRTGIVRLDDDISVYQDDSKGIASS